MYNILHVNRMQSGFKCRDFYAEFSFAQVIQYLAMLCNARTSYVIRTQEGLISGIPRGFKGKRFPFIVVYLFICGYAFFPFHKLQELTGALVACARVF